MAIRNSCNEKIEDTELNDDLIESYNENGYVIIKDIILVYFMAAEL